MNIEDFKDRHAGQDCYLLGSGPSLATMDLSSLRDKVTFSCNRGYLLFEQLGFSTSYWAMEDALDHEQFGTAFAAFAGPTKFVASDLPFAGAHVSVPFDRTEGFSVEPPFKFGGTVMHFMLQLARYMGCATAYLLGNDFRWKTDGGVTDVDVDHFDPSYWPPGTRQFPPQPERMRRAFLGARGHGLRIVNATPGSALDVFETQKFYRPLSPIHMEQHPEEIQPLAMLVRELQPQHVIEIGVRAGGTCALWHEICSGLVVGVDRAINLDVVRRYPRFRGVEGSSHDAVTLYRVKELLGGEPVDFLFIDGDHSYDGTRRDSSDYCRFVRPGGIVAFHDVNADAQYFEEWEQGGSPRFWRELEWPGKQTFSVDGVWGGIGVIRV